MQKHFLFKLLGTIMILAIALATFTACDDAVVNVKVTFMLDEQEVYKVVDLESGDEVKLPEEPTKDGFVFDGWYLDKGTWEKQFFGKIEDTSVIKIAVYAKWSDMKIIEFGSYPQTEVKDSATISALNATANLSTTAELDGWTDYYSTTDGYERNYMFYKDISYNGEKYRGVYINNYRRVSRYVVDDTDMQNLNGYSTNTCYWFKYEPLKWRVLTENDGKALLLCDSIIDSQPYQMYIEEYRDYEGTDSDAWYVKGYEREGIYANNYEYSTIRAWLNGNFYKTAFDQDQQLQLVTTEVDNGARSTNPNDDATYWNNGVNDYACDNTVDKVFLLSMQEITDPSYGFKSISREGDLTHASYEMIGPKIKVTDYEKIQGGMSNITESSALYFWLRSPNYSGYSANIVCGLSEENTCYSFFIELLALDAGKICTVTSIGVLPAIWLDLTSQELLGKKGLEYTLNDDGESYSITGIGTCRYTDLIIPDTYNSKPVTKIGDSAFYECDQLTSVTISDNITAIGDSAFCDCDQLTSVTISSSDTSIGDYAFADCNNLYYLFIPDDFTFNGENAFLNCSKLNLRIEVMVDGGGLGSNKWVTEAGKRFAAVNANTIWRGADGSVKIGAIVETRVSNGVSMSASSKTATTTIFDLTSVQDLSSYVNGGYILEIDDIMTEKFDERGSSKISVDDKIDAQNKGRFQYNGKYYAAPSIEYYPGLAYNANMFAKKGYYFAASSEGAVKFHSDVLNKDFYFLPANSTSGKSCGPDGKLNTSDDGLPSSLYEFIALCEYMKHNAVSPIDFSGQIKQYSNFILSGLMSSLMGYDRMSGTYSFNGTYEVVTGFTNENLFPGVDGIKKPTTKTVTVTEENGYYTTWSIEKYYAEAFLELAMRAGWLSSSCTSNGVNQRDAERKFVFSGVNGAEEIGMHADGSFWYNEANIEGIFEDWDEIVGMGSLGENGYHHNGLKWMPLPVSISESVTTENGLGRGQTLIDMWNSMLVINSNVKGKLEEQAAKAFLQFLCSDSELSKYTALTSVIKSLNYDMDATDYNAMSNYGKDLWNMVREDESNKIVYFEGGNKTFKANSNTFAHGWNTDGAFSVKTSPSYYQYKIANTSATLDEIFKLQAISKASWEGMYQGSKTVTDVDGVTSIT